MAISRLRVVPLMGKVEYVKIRERITEKPQTQRWMEVQSELKQLKGYYNAKNLGIAKLKLTLAKLGKKESKVPFWQATVSHYSTDKAKNAQIIDTLLSTCQTKLSA